MEVLFEQIEVRIKALINQQNQKELLMTKHQIAIKQIETLVSKLKSIENLS